MLIALYPLVVLQHARARMLQPVEIPAIACVGQMALHTTTFAT